MYKQIKFKKLQMLKTVHAMTFTNGCQWCNRAIQNQLQVKKHDLIFCILADYCVISKFLLQIIQPCFKFNGYTSQLKAYKQGF